MRNTQRFWVPTTRGFRLALVVDQPESDAIGTILMSHCFTCSKDLKTIVRLSQRLNVLGWTTSRFDFAGIGQSEGKFSESNFDTNLADLASVHTFLQGVEIEVDFLFGHSFGGAASILYANEHSGDAANPICGVVTFAAPSDTAHLADILVSKNPRIETNGHGIVEIGGRPFTISDAMLKNFRSTEFSSRLKSARTRTVNPAAHLIIQSIIDETVECNHAYELFETLSSQSLGDHADVSLCLLSDADHLLMSDARHIESVAHMIHGWCLQRKGGRFSGSKYN